MENGTEQALRQLRQALQSAQPKQRHHLLPLLEQLEGLLEQRRVANDKTRAALRPALDTVIRLMEDVLDGAVSR